MAPHHRGTSVSALRQPQHGETSRAGALISFHPCSLFLAVWEAPNRTNPAIHCSREVPAPSCRQRVPPAEVSAPA